MASVNWLLQFMKRQKVISLKNPEPTGITALTKIRGMNRTDVNHFYEIMKDVKEEYNFEPRNIYNVDETGINVVHKSRKILALKGEERGKNVTVFC